MPGSLTSWSNSYFGGNISTSVNNGSLTMERLDDMCRRIMVPYYNLQQDIHYPPIDGSEPGLNGNTRESVYRGYG